MRGSQNRRAVIAEGVTVVIRAQGVLAASIELAVRDGRILRNRF